MSPESKKVPVKPDLKTILVRALELTQVRDRFVVLVVLARVLHKDFHERFSTIAKTIKDRFSLEVEDLTTIIYSASGSHDANDPGDHAILQIADVLRSLFKFNPGRAAAFISWRFRPPFGQLRKALVGAFKITPEEAEKMIREAEESERQIRDFLLEPLEQ